MKANQYKLPRIAPLALAVCAALSSQASADPLLGVKLFRDSDVMFRDSDMSRWTDSYAEIGLGYNSNDSFKFGQYSGLTDQGFFPILGFNWVSRNPAQDSESFRFYGANLATNATLDASVTSLTQAVPRASRRVEAEYGVQGAFNISASLNQLLKSQTESAMFLHNGLGTNYLTLPGGTCASVPATNPQSCYSDATGVQLSQLKPFEVVQGRDVYRMTVSANFAAGWDASLALREDVRDGTRLTGLYQNRAMIVPYPIADTTRQIEAGANYADSKLQMNFSYALSRYDNELKSFNVQNPYNTTAPFQITNLRMSMAPSNDSHQTQATLAYNVDRDTRVLAKLSYGVASQNDPFLPYSANGNGATAALPAASLDGKVVTKLVDLAVMTRPMPGVSVKAGVQHRDFDNQTPRLTVVYPGRDVATAGTTVRTNAPVSTTENRVYLDGDYLVMDRTVLRGTVERASKSYEFADRASTDTDKLSLDLRRTVSDELVGNVGYVYTRRTGSGYDKNEYYRDTQGSYATSLTPFTNHPSMRAFLYSDYSEHKARSTANWTASEVFSLQGIVDFSRRTNGGPNCATAVDPKLTPLFTTLPDVCLGQKHVDSLSLNLDAQWQPEENITLFAFGNYSQSEIDQLGRLWGTVAQGQDASRDYTVTSTYHDATAGLGLKWQPVDRWDVGGTLISQRSYGLTDITGNNPAVFTGANAVGQLPTLKTRLTSLQLFAKFDYSKRVTWRVNYLVESLKSTDWSYDNLAANTVANVLLTGQASPKYTNQVIGVSMALKTW